MDIQPVLCSCRSTSEVPAPRRPSGTPLILLPTAREATGAVHRPGKVVVSFKKYKGPSCTFHAKLLMEASGQPATPGFSEPSASEGDSTWTPAKLTRVALQRQHKGDTSALLSGCTFIFSFTKPSSPPPPCTTRPNPPAPWEVSIPCIFPLASLLLSFQFSDAEAPRHLEHAQPQTPSGTMTSFTHDLEEKTGGKEVGLNRKVANLFLQRTDGNSFRLHRP